MFSESFKVLVGSRSESKIDPYSETSANSRRHQSASPEPFASTGRSILKNNVNQKATVRDATPNECSPEGTTKSPSHHDHRKRLRFQDISSEGDDHVEDPGLPSKRKKTLLTTRMLKLSRITRRAIAASMRHDRLRSRELELLKSILDEGIEKSKTKLDGIDLQISSIEDTLRDAGVDIGNQEPSLSEDNVRMFSGDEHDSEASWHENDSCSVSSSGSASYYVPEQSFD
ncbi:hypothetical protein DEU56DRAFT_985170 [Suillus clintonianus]|uniref:uncharacterized protein n=1 Tax=Suillus clintonianus TaxID=1904413 RepID=UPI001B88423B|nr:uncharacterized protein DEU56DRAFT_985170 [Suillus clintonianus]KAG2114128.1 hypothetical protein DEU56DRAFT_985170 [Suillus clintonianus]